MKARLMRKNRWCLVFYTYGERQSRLSGTTGLKSLRLQLMGHCGD
jgi:hypothetical protein